MSYLFIATYGDCHLQDTPLAERQRRWSLARGAAKLGTRAG
ncbi:MAG: hypothetical protein RLZZ221_2413, partial [Verrucomicrobiota bacterium]